jgi:hypothetical protein
MSLELKAPPEVEGLSVILPPDLMERFEIADRQLREIYGLSPGVTVLVRLWLACTNPSEIRDEFERAVMDINKGVHNTNAKGSFHADCQ